MKYSLQAQCDIVTLAIMATFRVCSACNFKLNAAKMDYLLAASEEWTKKNHFE